MVGCLHQTSHDKQYGFLSFIRLVGTCYFKKHATAFVALKGHKTSLHLFNSIDPSLQPEDRHHIWLNTIREAVSDIISSEEDRVPTITSLWLRYCWVSQIWRNSTNPDMFALLQAPEIQLTIKENVEFLMKGCSCTKGSETLRHGCKKQRRSCGPGCLCQGWANLNAPEILQDETDSEVDSDSEDEQNSVDEEFELVEEVITDDLFFETYDTIKTR